MVRDRRWNKHYFSYLLKCNIQKLKCYSIQPKNWIFVKDYWFFCFAKNVSKNIGENLNGKFSQKLLDHAKQSATDTLKTASKIAI